MALRSVLLEFHKVLMKPDVNSSDPADDVTRRKNALSHRSFRVTLLALGVALLGAAGWGLHTSNKSHRVAWPQVAAQAESNYVDPAVCATCHASIAATYKKTGMGRSFYKPTPRNTTEDYSHKNTIEHRASGMTYSMIEHDGKLFQRRHTVDSNGAETNVAEEQVDYVIGSGNHAHTYLHRTQQGKLMELPVSWYAETGTWGMSPGYDRANQQDFRSTVAPECLFCHNGYPQLDKASEPYDADHRVFPAKLPEGIDCQRCHGPGSAHVAAASSRDSTMEQIHYSIVNPGKLPRDRQLEVCMECHLETSSRNMPNEIRVFDRPVLSYRPGQPLGDYKYLFDREKDAADDTFEVAHAAYRLRKSKCFLNSQMTCLTCHNPHDIPRGKEATKTYVAVCRSCHQTVRHTVALAAGSDCISCHMPKRRTEDIVHVVMTDHYIQRNKPARNLLAALPEKLIDKGPDSAVVLYYPTAANDSKAELYVAVAQANDGKDGEGIQRLEALLNRQTPSAPEPYLALGRAYLHRGNDTQAVQWFNAALKHAPDNRPALEALGPALIAMNQDDKALEALKRGVSVYPDDDMLLTNLGNVYLRKDMPTESKAALDKAIAVNPELPDAYNLLGLLALQTGDKAAAEKSFREAIRLQPDHTEAQTNLGTLLTGRHEFVEAKFHFLKAIETDPTSADAHHGFGLLLLMTRSIPDATTELREAVRLRPGSAQNHSDLADLLVAQGAVPEAAEEYEQVLRLKPDQADAQLGLGMALLQERKVDEAVAHLNRASLSSDPEVSGAAKKVLAQLGR